MVLRLAAQWTCALVGARDCFDPRLAEAAGVDLSHMLWVRCSSRYKKLNAVEQAFKVADILVHSGGFEMIMVDLSGVAERLVRKVPLTTWHRFSRVAERTSTTVIFLTSIPVAQSCADLTLHIRQGSGIWTALQQCINSENPPHTKSISGIDAEYEVVREKLREPIQSFQNNFPQISKRA